MMDTDAGRVAAQPGSREPSPSVSAASGFDPSRIPSQIVEQVLNMGRAEWGATAKLTDSGHIAHLTESLQRTREHFGFEDVPCSMHGLYLEGTETVLAHTGTSPNSGANAQALTGAWNWLYEQCVAQRERDSDGNPEGGNEVPSRSDESAAPEGIAQSSAQGADHAD